MYVELKIDNAAYPIRHELIVFETSMGYMYDRIDGFALEVTSYRFFDIVLLRKITSCMRRCGAVGNESFLEFIKDTNTNMGVYNKFWYLGTIRNNLFAFSGHGIYLQEIEGIIEYIQNNIDKPLNWKRIGF